MKKPTAKMPAVFMSWAVGLPLGKKEPAKYVAKLAYTNQSNHSTMLPAEPTQIFFHCCRPMLRTLPE